LTPICNKEVTQPNVVSGNPCLNLNIGTILEKLQILCPDLIYNNLVLPIDAS
jgi:hypothetical protein